MTNDDYEEALVASFYKTRGSVRGVLTLVAELLLPIEGLCDKLTYVPISVVARVGSVCLDALREPTRYIPLPCTASQQSVHAIATA